MVKNNVRFGACFIFRRPQDSTSIACDYEQGDLFYFVGPHGTAHQPDMKQLKRSEGGKK